MREARGQLLQVVDHESAWSASRPAWLLALALVTLFGLGLSWTGIDHGLPHNNEPDDDIVVDVYRLTAPELVPADFEEGIKYPIVVAALVAVIRGGEVRAPSRDASLEEHLETASGLHSTTRRVVAGLSALLIPATFLLARRFLAPGWSMLAAMFVATCLLHLCYSAQARPHGPVTTFAVFAVLAALWMAHRGSVASLLTAGFSTGLAAGCLHSGLVALGPLVVASAFLVRARKWRGLWRLSIPWGVAAMVIWWAYAPTFDAPDVDQPNRESTPSSTSHGLPAGPTLTLSGHELHFTYLGGRGFAVLVEGLRSHDPVLLVLAATAIVAIAFLALRRRRLPVQWIDALVPLAFFLPLLVVFGVYDFSLYRYFAPLMPFMAILSAIGVRALVTPLRRGRRVWGPIVAVVSLMLPVAVSVKYAWLRSRPDTMTEAAKWIGDNLDRDLVRVFVGNLRSLPVFQHLDTATPSPGSIRSLWERYQFETYSARDEDRGYHLRYPTVYELRALAKEPGRRAQVRSFIDDFGADHAVVNSSISSHEHARYYSPVTIRAVEDVGCVLLQRFDPFPGEQAVERSRYLTYDLGQSAAVDILRARCLGPRIDIYRLDR